MTGVRLRSICGIATALVLIAIGVRANPDGAALYEKNCIPCHGPDGHARTPAARKLRVKDLTESRLPDDGIAHQIANGTRDAAGKARMPAFKSDLTGPEIAALVEFVKSLRK